MNCHEARELCSALIDDVLSADERAVLQSHLTGCADCGRELDRLRQTVSLLGGLAPVRAPVGFVDRVLTAARPDPWHWRALRALRVPFRVRLPLEAAALLVMGGLAVYVFQHTPELQRAARNETPGMSAPVSSPADTRVSGKARSSSAARDHASAPVPTAAEKGPTASGPIRPAAEKDPTASGPVPPASDPSFTSARAEAPPSQPSDRRSTTSLSRSPQAPAPPAAGGTTQAAPSPASARPEASITGGAPPAPSNSAPAASSPLFSSDAGAKESQAEAARMFIEARQRAAIEARQRAADELAKTRNADPTEENRRKAAQAPGARDQKMSDTRADVAASDSGQPASRAPATPPADEGARKAAASGGPPPAPSTVQSPSSASNRDEPASRLARQKAVELKPAEPAFRGRQEIAARSVPGPQGAADVSAILFVSDRGAALQALADLVARAQGRELARRPEANGTVVDMLIPRADYTEFAQGLARLGQLVIPFESSTLPAEVHVSVRVRP